MQTVTSLSGSCCRYSIRHEHSDIAHIHDYLLLRHRRGGTFRAIYTDVHLYTHMSAHFGATVHNQCLWSVKLMLATHSLLAFVLAPLTFGHTITTNNIHPQLILYCDCDFFKNVVHDLCSWWPFQLWCRTNAEKCAN